MTKTTDTASLLADLRAVRELLSQPERWTQGWYARDSHGYACDPDDPAAVCWSLLGAVEHVTGNIDYTNPCLLRLLAELPDGQSMNEWHDDEDPPHEEVMELIDRAIAAAGGNE